MVALPHLTKAVDQYQTALTLNSTPQFTLLNAIQNGSGSTQRIGSKIRLAGVQIKAFFQTRRTTSSVWELFRIMVVYDRQPNGSAPAIGDILGGRDYASTAITSNPTVNLLNPDNRDRFVLLYDKTISPRAASVAAGPTTPFTNVAGDMQYMAWQKFIKIPGLDVVYGNSSTPPVIGDIKSGSLYIITLGSVASGSESQDLLCQIRTFFHDDPY